MASFALREMEARKIKVNRAELVAKLAVNREQHARDYEEAVKGYKEEVHKFIDLTYDELAYAIGDLQLEAHSRVDDYFDGKKVDFQSVLEPRYFEKSPPKSYLDHYDTAIAMFSWETKDEVELSYAEFNCFVRDLWDWKQSFDTSISAYKK